MGRAEAIERAARALRECVRTFPFAAVARGGATSSWESLMARAAELDAAVALPVEASVEAPAAVVAQSHVPRVEVHVGAQTLVLGSLAELAQVHAVVERALEAHRASSTVVVTYPAPPIESKPCASSPLETPHHPGCLCTACV